ncbi:copper amine oxidase N-terminal domain-containing protein [Paenibacillus xanthanilyticus]|uniref:Copper amine oxidase N-terminal domain-containing protein n=1 Tax=Paenibacillus xanthanilyticus TaxID=1783531 RepID=A0ABV8K6Q2_9BACL
MFIAFTDPYAKTVPAPQPPQQPLEIVVTLDGRPMYLTKAPLLSQGSIFVPMRELFSRLGADVSFDTKKKLVIAQKGNTKIMYRLGDAHATINGKQVRMEAGYRTLNSQVYMPLRFVSEVFGYKVVYDGSLFVVKITTW